MDVAPPYLKYSKPNPEQKRLADVLSFLNLRIVNFIATYDSDDLKAYQNENCFEFFRVAHGHYNSVYD